ncbi:WAS/WASL-interacting protein family member 2-like isoform X2 [Takifugu flavidus]|uniref:WAS/WASL-interacting protein family member 2-like isoform X2 n=1 Tax=Takifugu flavidus TaxID=433684 RepID=UPI002544C401|nr:WAS/WASL-interacting protein family member 2-like isoform X2 [Takifugu flavidus]
MPIPPPPPPGGAPPAPTFSQVKSSPRLLKQEVGEGRSALLSDICQGTRLKKVAVVNDRSAPLLDTPPVPGQSSRVREAPPPPPYRTHGSPSLSDHPARGKPPPRLPRRPVPLPPPPPPPPALRNGHSSCSIPRSFVDDFESKYSFHPLDDFPPPEEYRHFTKIYPSRASRVMRGAPPLPPVGR